MSIRRAASWAHPLQESSEPRGARTEAVSVEPWDVVLMESPC